MTEIKKEEKETVTKENCLVCNCIIMAGVFKVVNFIKGLFAKTDNKKSVE